MEIDSIWHQGSTLAKFQLTTCQACQEISPLVLPCGIPSERKTSSLARLIPLSLWQRVNALCQKDYQVLAYLSATLSPSNKTVQNYGNTLLDTITMSHKQKDGGKLKNLNSYRITLTAQSKGLWRRRMVRCQQRPWESRSTLS